MTEIVGQLEWLRVSDTHVRIISSPIVTLNSGRTFHLHGLEYDGGSVPAPANAFIPRLLSKFDWAFACHDDGYQQSRDGDGCIWTRKEVDDALLEVAVFCGADIVLASAAYRAVRNHGWKHWGEGTFDGITPLEDPPGFEWFRA